MLVRTAALVLASALALAGCSGDDGDSPTAEDTAPTSASADATQCSYQPDGSSPAKEAATPPATPAVTGTVHVDMKTSVGSLGLDLDADAAPCTVNSFVSLAKQGYFDDTTCHRLTTEGIFVLQCGDPTGSGSGGPGYSFPDELQGDETYPAGTLAMANAGPNTNGSQFFIVYGDTQLDPNYTVFGTVDSAGIDLVKKVARDGTDNAFGQGDGHPNTMVDIESMKVG
jgi:peptidyl-prolyl cis-trans isomerase B (cyclophilin B)